MTESARSRVDVDHVGPAVAVVTSNNISLRFPNVDAAVRSACDAYNAGTISYVEMDNRIRQARSA